MSSTIASQAPPTETCLLFRLPPELRLHIYHHTYSLRLETQIRWKTEDLEQSWASTPLVSLAATCRLIANEACVLVRSLPASQRVAHMEIFQSNRAERRIQAYLRHLPCPITDLRRVVVTYDFTKHRSAADLPPIVNNTEAVREAMRSMETSVMTALRKLIHDEALSTATELAGFGLRITGLQRNGAEESQTEAVRRILDGPVGCASAENLAQAIRRRSQDAGNFEEDGHSSRLATWRGRHLYLLL